MPFADAKYPPPRTFYHHGLKVRERTTAVPLANGETLLVIEQRQPVSELVLAIACPECREEVDWTVCSITHRGVLAHTYSADACERLAEEATDA